MNEKMGQRDNASGQARKRVVDLLSEQAWQCGSIDPLSLSPPRCLPPLLPSVLDMPDSSALESLRLL